MELNGYIKVLVRKKEKKKKSSEFKTFSFRRIKITTNQLWHTNY